MKNTNSTPSFLPVWAYPWLLFIVVFLLFRTSFANRFTNWQDILTVLENPYLAQFSWAKCKALFTNFYSNDYMPLTHLSYALNYALGEFEAKGYIMFNVLLHLANVLLVYGLGRLVFAQSAAAPALAFAVALLFGVHPLQVEGVVWISARRDVLSAFFALAACWAYTSPDRGKGKYALALICFGLAGLASARVAPLPLAILLFATAQGKGQTSGKQWLPLLPFAAISLLLLGAAYLANAPAAAMLPPYGLVEKILLGGYALMQYLVKAVAPTGLVPYHAYPFAPGGSVPLVVWAHWLGLFSVPVAAYWLAKHNRLALGGLLYFLVMLLPALPLWPTTVGAWAEHYFYLAAPGFLVAAVAVVRQWWQAQKLQSYMLYLALSAYLLVLAAASYRQIEVWRDPFSIWDSVLAEHPDDATALAYLGQAKYLRRDTQAALGELGRALALDPKNMEALDRRASIYYEQRDYQNALTDYEKAVRLAPKSPDLYNNRANVYLALRQFNEAMRSYDTAIMLASRRHSYYSNRGMTRYTIGDYNGALGDFNQSNTLSPNADAYNGLGLVYFITSKPKECEEAFNKALEINPLLAPALYNRGAVRLELGKKDEACQDFYKALELGYTQAQEAIKRRCQ